MELVQELDVMKKKSEVFDGFQDHEAMTTVQFDKRISKLTVDHGREYKERITVERVPNGVERILNCFPTALVHNDRTPTEYRDRSANVDGGGGEELSIVHEGEERPG